MEVSEEQIFTLKSFLLTYFMPEKCYDLFFQRWDFTHVPCLKIVLSKLMGFWIMGTLLAPLPQILKVYRAGSSEGLSLVSVLLDLVTVLVHIGFCVQHRFPFEAWAESVFVLLQFSLLTFLIQHYRGNSVKGGVSLLCAGFMYLLMSSFIPPVVISAAHEWAVLIIISSRLIQVGCNHSSRSTGQLSGLCVFLLFMGSLGQVFSSMQNSGHSVHSQACVLSSCCSAVLLLQVLLFRNQQSTDGEVEKRKEE